MLQAKDTGHITNEPPSPQRDRQCCAKSKAEIEQQGEQIMLHAEEIAQLKSHEAELLAKQEELQAQLKEVTYVKAASYSCLKMV